MNYLRHYKKLVRRAFHSNRNREDDVYYEGHHVKMKSLGGKRIVLLTAKEHFIAHFLLYKHYKKHGDKNKKIKSARAFKCLTFSSKDNIPRYNSRSFEYARIAFNESMRGENHYMYGKKHPPELLKQISNSIKNMPKERKDAMRKKQRDAKLGTQWSDEQRKNILAGRARYYDSLPPKYRITFTDGNIIEVRSLGKTAKEYNLSRSMLRRFLDGGPAKNTSVRDTIKINNTIGIIIESIVEDTCI